MAQILLQSENNSHTPVPNAFIDDYMSEANESQVKIYLYLLQCLNLGHPLDVSSIADKFNYMEKDVLRALIYLDEKGLISVTFDESHNVTGICLNTCRHITPARCAEPVRKERPGVNELPTETTQFFTLEQMKNFKSRPDVTNLIYMTQHYLNKTLSMNDLNNLLFIHDTLGFPIDLIEYLVEYCANINKASIKYITSVAIAWSEQNIRTVRDARAKIEGAACAKECAIVLKELGIDRSPTKADLELVKKWLEEYRMNMDVITVACQKTIAYAGSATLKYTDRILSRWHENGAHTLDEVKALDEEHEQSKKKTARSAKGASNKFNNFSGRDTDYNDLAQAIMNSQDKL